MDMIIDGVYISSYREAMDEELLRSNNIRSIVCIMDEDMPNDTLDMYSRLNIKRMFIEMCDSPLSNIRSHFSCIIDFIKGNPEGNLLVHCFAGASRSVTAVAAYMLHIHYEYYESKGCDTGTCQVDDILSMIRSRRRASDPNLGFIYQLTQYEHELRPGNTGKPIIPRWCIPIRPIFFVDDNG